MENGLRWYRYRVTFENTAVALAENASRALRDLDQYGPHLRPDRSDSFGWSADVLDELARAAELLGRAVEHTTGVADVDVTRRSHELARAVVAHRNALLRDESGPAPVARSAEVTSPRSV